MAYQRGQKVNRYKQKGGRGGLVLAVFLLFTVLLISGGYYLQQYLTSDLRKNVIEQAPRQEPQQSVLKPVSTTAIGKPDPNSPVRHYFDDDVTTDRPGEAPATSGPKGKGLLAIIIDDMGSSIQEAQSLAEIGVPVTFSVIPGLRHDRVVAAFAAERGIEVMAHMPMQSKEYPKRRLESNGLLTTHDHDEIRHRVNAYLDTLPQAVGANNHTGSAFTEDAARMRVVLGVIKQRRLFFIDSITTPATKGFRLSREMEVPTARRDIFLDNEHNENYIMGQLEKAVMRARSEGRAIAIGHPYPETISVLSKALPALGNKGVVLVPASRLVR